MLTPSSPGHQTNLFGTDLLQQLDRTDPLLRLADTIPWRELDQAFSRPYTQGHGRPAKPIRLMVGLLMLKQLENLSDEALVLQFKRNPYYQAFCGVTEFSLKPPCDSTELVHFRNRIGSDGVDKLLRGVAIFAIDFSGLPARKISKNHATANAFGGPDSSCYVRFNPTRG